MHLEDGLRSGLIPQELPPCFTSQKFASTAPHLSEIPAGKWTSPTKISAARPGRVRRNLEIPNPLGQYHVVKTVSENWRKIQAITALSPYSLTRPVRRLGSPRSIAHRVPIDHWSRERLRRMPGGKFTLTTDISQFYPSIYTHALDWAIRGKEKAKRRMREAGLGPTVDKVVRSARAGQTSGLSIGPDTSWVLAEMLLGRVDADLDQAFPHARGRILRYSDDMTVYASSEQEALDILAHYQSSLAHFELDLNSAKVSITDGLLPTEGSWVRGLRTHRYRDTSDSLLTSDIIDLFDLALEYRDSAPHDGVLSYAIKRCDPFPDGRLSWPTYQDMILASISLDPSTIPHAYSVLRYGKDRGLNIDSSKVVEIVNQEIVHHARWGHGFEIVWLLYLLRDLNLELDTESAVRVSAMDDNCSLLLLRDIASSDTRLAQLSDDLFENAVTRAESDGALSSDDWLLAYEFRHNSWSRPKKWDEFPAWKELHEAKVGFFIPRTQPVTRPLRRRRPIFSRSPMYP